MAIASKKKRPNRSIHHQKRHGLHQKRSPHFIKTYWPYMPMLLVVVIGLAINSLWMPHHNQGVLGYATNISTGALFSDTNSQRAANGVAALALNGQLNQAAQAKANDMVTRDYWSHNTPDGNPPWVFITNAGYQFSTAGENLAYGFDTSDSTVTGWMNSAEHRANILNSAVQDVGFGYANSANFQGSGAQTVVVAMYAKATSVAAAPEPAVAKPPAPAPAPKVVAPTPVTVTPIPESPAPATPTPAVSNPTPLAKASTTITTASKTVAEPASQKVSRIQIVTAGSAPWSLFVASTLMSAGFLVFVIKHGLGLRRVYVLGEDFIIKHRLLDFVLVSTSIAGFIFTRTTGFIR